MEVEALVDELAYGAIARDLKLMSALQKLSPKAFTDLVLNSFPGSTHLQDILMEEICSRIHPGWEKEVENFKV